MNNTTTCPHITVKRDGIADSGSTLHCYRRDTTTDNDSTDAVLNDVQPDGSQIVSILQAIMKVSTLNKEACRGYNFTTLTQNLISLPVIEDNGCTITLDRTRIKVTKSGKQVIGGYRKQKTRLWRLKLEDAPKEEDKLYLCIRNGDNNQNINAVLTESNINDML